MRDSLLTIDDWPYTPCDCCPDGPAQWVANHIDPGANATPEDTPSGLADIAIACFPDVSNEVSRDWLECACAAYLARLEEAERYEDETNGGNQ